MAAHIRRAEIINVFNPIRNWLQESVFLKINIVALSHFLHKSRDLGHLSYSDSQKFGREKGPFLATFWTIFSCKVSRLY